MGKCCIQITSQVCRREDNLLKTNKNSTNMVHNGAPNVGTFFNDYFYIVNLLLNLNGTSCFLLWEKLLPPFGHFFLYENINFHL
jgi:hypothetical protein